MGLGGCGGLDGTHVDSSRKWSARKQVVQPDGQGGFSQDPGAGLCASASQPRGGGSRSRNDRGVRATLGREPGKAGGRTAGGKLPTAGHPPSLDYQAGEQRETPLGNSHGARPSGANGAGEGTKHSDINNCVCHGIVVS